MPEDRGEALTEFSAWLAETLGLQDIDDELAERAIVDPLFLNQLIVSRDDAASVHGMLATTSRSLPKWAVPATLQSIGRVTMAMSRWAAIGFRPVDDCTVDARMAACRQCPHLGSPSAMIQRLAAGSGGKVCDLCSCAVGKKAILPTEVCPAPDPDRPGLSRWGEPRA